MNDDTSLRFDQPSVLLVLSNIFTIIFAVIEHWSLSQVMWIYWGQSLIIGVYNWKRIRHLKQFSTEGFEINRHPVSPTEATQRQVASFFALHYGFFHLVYLGFLFKKEDPAQVNILGSLLCVGAFAFNHWSSFQHVLERDLSRTPNIGTVMFFPYLRIIPMHLTILLGNFFAKGGTGTLVIFLVLKTVADLILHLIEHREEIQPPGEVNDHG